MLGSRQQGSHVLAKNGLPADGNCVEGGAVKGIPHGDGFMSSGSHPRQFYRHPDGFSPPRAE